MTRQRVRRRSEASDRHAMAPTSADLQSRRGRQIDDYGRLVSDISSLLEQARCSVVRSANSVLAATYWQVGRHVVEFEQGGKPRAEYGEKLLTRLAGDLTAAHGRGFSARNLRQMRTFYLGWEIWQTPSAKLEARVRPIENAPANLPKGQTVSAKSTHAIVPVHLLAQTTLATASVFPLSWSQYVRLMSVENPEARAFYESEAIRGGWSVRQLDRQISTQFYERAVGAKDRAALLARGQKRRPEDAVSLEDEVRDPYLLEFLNLKDEYSESDLEEALVRHLEAFLLELGNGFAFVARQKRIRIGDEWYRLDLLLFHRRLKCLVVVDLKIGRFTHADAGQMNLYLNYVREHMTEPGENEPVGVVLCSAKNDAVVHYAMGGIKAKVFASRYLTVLPDEESLRKEILKTQRTIRAHWKERTPDE